MKTGRSPECAFKRSQLCRSLDEPSLTYLRFKKGEVAEQSITLHAASLEKVNAYALVEAFGWVHRKPGFTRRLDSPNTAMTGYRDTGYRSDRYTRCCHTDDHNDPWSNPEHYAWRCRS